MQNNMDTGSRQNVKKYIKIMLCHQYHLPTELYEISVGQFMLTTCVYKGFLTNNIHFLYLLFFVSSYPPSHHYSGRLVQKLYIIHIILLSLKQTDKLVKADRCQVSY